MFCFKSWHCSPADLTAFVYAAFDYNYTSAVIHVAKLTGLAANTTYFYQVLSEYDLWVCGPCHVNAIPHHQ